jgi:hypothetical protein
MNDLTTAGFRMSGSNLSLRPTSNRIASTQSTISRVGSYRYALLKSNAERQQSIEKIYLLLLVLTHYPPTLTDKDTTQNFTPRRPTTAQVVQVAQPALALPFQASILAYTKAVRTDNNLAMHPTGHATTDNSYREVVGDGICFP